jgi:hypothetical protein
MQIDLTYLEGMIRFRQRVNNASLEDIEWVRDGIIVPISQELIDEWNFTGLNNTDFALQYLISPLQT